MNTQENLFSEWVSWYVSDNMVETAKQIGFVISEDEEPYISEQFYCESNVKHLRLSHEH